MKQAMLETKYFSDKLREMMVTSLITFIMSLLHHLFTNIREFDVYDGCWWQVWVTDLAASVTNILHLQSWKSPPNIKRPSMSSTFSRQHKATTWIFKYIKYITYKIWIPVLHNPCLLGRLLMGMKVLFLLIVLDIQPIYNYRPFKKYSWDVFSNFEMEL